MTPEQLKAESFLILSRLQSGTESVVSLSVALHALEAALSQAEAYRVDAERLRAAQEIVNEQAEEEGLWCIPDSIVEAFFQQELRRLHAAIEGDAARKPA